MKSAEHIRSPRRVEPTRDEVLADIEPADTGGHWYWLGEVMQDCLDFVPVIRRDGATWSVLRLLLPTEGRARRVNHCGLRTCVNPEHWSALPVEDGVVLTNFDGRGWRRA